jgi:predicted enzyme related to lactoylglutathione lyase
LQQSQPGDHKMPGAVARLTTVVINVTDVQRETTFWSALLGVKVRKEFPGFVWLMPQQEHGVMVALQAVVDPTPGRNRLHLDLKVADVPAAIAWIAELGGELLETHEMGGFTWRVMADPEGNEFCISAG